MQSPSLDFFTDWAALILAVSLLTTALLNQSLVFGVSASRTPKCHPIALRTACPRIPHLPRLAYTAGERLHVVRGSQWEELRDTADRHDAIEPSRRAAPHGNRGLFVGTEPALRTGGA